MTKIGNSMYSSVFGTSEAQMTVFCLNHSHHLNPLMKQLAIQHADRANKFRNTKEMMLLSLLLSSIDYYKLK